MYLYISNIPITCNNKYLVVDQNNIIHVTKNNSSTLMEERKRENKIQKVEQNNSCGV